jgi:hypothetical protein
MALANEGEQAVNAFRKRIEAWFDSQMARTSGWYKRYAQAVAFGAGLILATSMNIDTLQIGSALWTNSHLREQTSGIAAALAKEGDSAYKNAQEELAKSSLPIGWSFTQSCFSDCLQDKTKQNFYCVWSTSLPIFFAKLIGLLLTALSVMLGANFWFELLTNLVNIRSSGAKPELTKKSKPTDKSVKTGAGDGSQ